jgi:hypothetical protein
MIASFTTPCDIGTNPLFFLWLVPLVLAISIVYKTTKLETIKPGIFLKEIIVLSGSIVVFVIIVAVVLIILAFLFV